MKIRTKKAFSLLGMGYGPEKDFPAGEYDATPATNQPDPEGKAFIESAHGVGLLLDVEDYETLPSPCPECNGETLDFEINGVCEYCPPPPLMSPRH